MDEQFSINLATIQNDLSRIEEILSTRLVNAILKKTTPNLDRNAVMRYKSARLWHHRNGWLWYAVMKVFMPFRLVKRGVFQKKSTVTIRSIAYAMLITIIWAGCLYVDPLRDSLFKIIWTLVVLGFAGPCFVALMVLLKNKELYAGAKDALAEVKYYGE